MMKCDINRSSNDQTVKRFILPSVFGALWNIKFSSGELRKFFSALKIMFRSSHSVLLMTLPFESNGVAYYDKEYMKLIFDYVIKLETLKSKNLNFRVLFFIDFEII